MAAPSSAIKDVIFAVAIVGGVLGGLFLYTGVWPPMVVVESGSMMHGTACPPPAGQPELCDPKVGYGKFGTIDPGDMVFVKKVTQREDVQTMAEAAAQKPDERNYGSPGDVVVYFPFNQRARTPIIHRAIAWVEVNGVQDALQCERTGDPGPGVSYEVFWDGRSHAFGSSGIYLPGLFAEPQYRQGEGYKPCWSGFITKGDNPVSNQYPDQALGGGVLPRQPVQISWVEGKAVGELPWFGLIKLALSGEENYNCTLSNGVQVWKANEPACDNGRAVRVLNANAPADLWVMLGVSLAGISIAPLAYDVYVLRGQKRRAELEAQGLDPGPTLTERLRLVLTGHSGKPPGGSGGSGDPPREEGADPRRAFEPPAEQPPPPPPGNARPAGSEGPEGTGQGRGFERLR